MERGAAVTCNERLFTPVRSVQIVVKCVPSVESVGRRPPGRVRAHNTRDYGQRQSVWISYCATHKPVNIHVYSP